MLSVPHIVDRLLRVSRALRRHIPGRAVQDPPLRSAAGFAPHHVHAATDLGCHACQKNLPVTSSPTVWIGIWSPAKFNGG